MNVNKLRGVMAELGINVEQLADMIECDKSSLYRNLNNSEKMTIGRAKKIKAALNLTDEMASAIFLP